MGDKASWLSLGVISLAAGIMEGWNRGLLTVWSAMSADMTITKSRAARAVAPWSRG